MNIKEFLKEIQAKSAGIKNQLSNLLTSFKSREKFDFKSIDFEGALHRFYSPINRANVQKFFSIAFVVSLTYGAGKMIGGIASLIFTPDYKRTIEKPVTPYISTNFKDETKAIEEANLFNTGTDEAQKKRRVIQNGICRDSKIQSPLPIKLVNTIVLQDSIKSIAAVQIRGSNNIETIREKDNISTIATLGKIEADKIIFRNRESGECEYISATNFQTSPKSGFTIHSEDDGNKLMAQQAAKEGIKNEGNKYTIKNKLRDEVLGDLGAILTQAKAIPITNPDGSMAFKIVNIVPGSIYSYLNIQDEDIIESINGKKIQNLNEVMSMFRDIKTISNLSIGVKRDGMEQNLEYAFEQ